MSVRGSIAVCAGRVTRWLLRHVLHRAGSQLPGRVALAIDPRAIEHLRGRPTRGSVVVCGTNGKTTTTNVIASALEAQGMSVLCNRDGANMAAGVVTALLEGGPADWAVLESDELSTVHILPQLQPSYLLLLNLFRDQLDRAGEIDHVQDTIVEALAKTPATTLVVCGDDPLSMHVAVRSRNAGTKVLAFGMREGLGLPPDRVPEARFCLQCGEELEYVHRSYAQLGRFFCPNCGFSTPELDYFASGVLVGHEGVSFDFGRRSTSDEWHLHAGFGGSYMAYNLLAATSVASLSGVCETRFQKALDEFHPENGRLQHFEVAGRRVVLNLAKNPTGFNQNISMLITDEAPKAVFVVINDDYNDGRDISWIWDVDFERLAETGDGAESDAAEPTGTESAGIVRCVAGGHRANDLQVRLKYAGVRATIENSVMDVLEAIADLPATCPLYVLTNYSALWPIKAELEGIADDHG